MSGVGLDHMLLDHMLLAPIASAEDPRAALTLSADPNIHPPDYLLTCIYSCLVCTPYLLYLTVPKHCNLLPGIVFCFLKLR